MAIEKIPQNKVNVISFFSPKGEPIDSSKLHSHLVDKYYTKEMNKLPFGFGPLVATTESVAASSLVWSFPSPATWINLFTTLGEWAQTWVAGTDFFNKKTNDLKEKLKQETNLDEKKNIRNKIREENLGKRQSREGAMAWLQIFAGFFGSIGFLWEKLFSNKEKTNNDDIPLYKKIILSGASALNVLLMFFGAGEKTLMSTFSKNGDEDGSKNLRGEESKNMEINGDSDRRCSLEWLVMSFIPWISNINLFKDVVDIGIIYGAVREGADYFLGENKMSFIYNDLKKESPKLQGFLKAFVNPLSLFQGKSKNKDDEEKSLVCFPFNYLLTWFLGTETDNDGPGSGGLRNNRLVPILKFFGCNPPACYLDKEGNVVSKFDLTEEEYEEAISEINEVVDESSQPAKTKPLELITSS